MVRDKWIVFSFWFGGSAAVNSETREEVAIKKIGNAFDNIVDAKRTLREIMLLRHMDHENVSLFLMICFPRMFLDLSIVVAHWTFIITVWSES